MAGIPIVVEDGTGLTGANSYSAWGATDSEPGSAREWFTAFFPNTDWTAAGEVKQKAAMVNMAWWMNGFAWVGQRLRTTQALAFPRYGYTPLVPAEVKQAHLLLVGYELRDGFFATVISGGALKRKKIGPIEKEWFAGASIVKSYPAVSQLLGAWLDIHAFAVADVSRAY